MYHCGVSLVVCKIPYKHMYMHLYLHVHVHVHAHIWMYMHMNMHVHTCKCTYKYPYKHIVIFFEIITGVMEGLSLLKIDYDPLH